MSAKTKTALFSALNLLIATASGQSIFDKAPKAQAESKDAPKPAAAAALATLTGAAAPAAGPAAAPAPAPAPAPKPTQVTIKDLAARQVASLEADANKRLTPPAATPAAGAVAGPILPAPVVGELSPASPIPVTMANPPKPLKDKEEKKKAEPPPPPARPYLAAVVGFAGREVAEIHVGTFIRTLKVGDSISEWKITAIREGRLILAGTTSKKIKKKLVTETKERVLSVGDTL